MGSFLIAHLPNGVLPEDLINRLAAEGYTFTVASKQEDITSFVEAKTTETSKDSPVKGAGASAAEEHLTQPSAPAVRQLNALDLMNDDDEEEEEEYSTESGSYNAPRAGGSGMGYNVFDSLKDPMATGGVEVKEEIPDPEFDAMEQPSTSVAPSMAQKKPLPNTFMNRRKVNIGLFRKKSAPAPTAKPNGLHKVYFRTVNPALTLEEIANITLQEKLKKLEQEKAQQVVDEVKKEPLSPSDHVQSTTTRRSRKEDLSLSVSGNDTRIYDPIPEPPPKRSRRAPREPGVSQQNLSDLRRNGPDEKVSKCHVEGCFAIFETVAELVEHMATHPGQKAFKCDLCLDQFTSRSALKGHMKGMHENNRPYGCTQCEQRFLQPSSLNKHMMMHADIRPYKCQLCLKAFRNLETLRQHKKTHLNKAKEERRLARLAAEQKEKEEREQMSVDYAKVEEDLKPWKAIIEFHGI